MKKVLFTLLILCLLFALPIQTSYVDSTAESVSRGIAYLNTAMKHTDYFPSYLLMSDTLPHTRKEDNSIFIHEVIVLALYPLRHNPQVKSTIEKGIQYLNREKSTYNGLTIFDYYGNNCSHTSASRCSCPDMDDTITAGLDLIMLGNAPRTYLAEIINKEISKDGTVPMWLFGCRIKSKALSSVLLIIQFEHDERISDPVVDANAYLGLMLADKDNVLLARYLNNLNEHLSSYTPDYYPSVYIYTYAVTRAYRDGNGIRLKLSMPSLVRFILARQSNDGCFGNALHTALALSSLKNAGYRGNALIKASKCLISKQGKDGSWPIEAFYINLPFPYIKKYIPTLTPNSYGSKALTTALAIEALSTKAR